jgi:hypothetical protein
LPPLLAGGFLVLDRDHLRLTDRGRPLLDAILDRLTGGLSPS